ncbi:MAG: phosphoribosyltransferase [Chloroflexi bacterium]|nr:phosphoribosyltransferase [Chloroflexota bacterium]
MYQFGEQQDSASARRNVVRPDPRFRDRRHAGQILARQLERFADRPDVLVLGLPRGGVPVAYEVARELGALLDVFIVRKLGVPGYEELAMGAIATGGVQVLDPEVMQMASVTQSELDAVIEREQRELARRESAFRGSRPPPEIAGRTVILVDDGLATGASMRAAVGALRRQEPRLLVVGVPVASRAGCRQFEELVDEIVCILTPEPFHAVGLWYQDFSDPSEDDIRAMLDRASGRGTDSRQIA